MCKRLSQESQKLIKPSCHLYTRILPVLHYTRISWMDDNILACNAVKGEPQDARKKNSCMHIFSLENILDVSPEEWTLSLNCIYVTSDLVGVLKIVSQ